MSALKPISFRKPVLHQPRVQKPAAVGTWHAWTPAEDAIIRMHYPQGGKTACAERLPEEPVGRTLMAISLRAAKLGVRYEGDRPNGRIRIKLPDGFDDALRDLYQNGDGKKRGEINAFAKRWNVPRWWASNRARELLLTVIPHKKGPPWTAAENALMARVPLHNPDKCAAIFRQHGFNRSPTAIVVRAKRLDISRRYSETLSATLIAKILGVDGKTVTREILHGDLVAVKRPTKRRPQQGGDPWSVEHADLRRYIIEHLERIDLRKVDKFAFVQLLAGEPLERSK